MKGKLRALARTLRALLIGSMLLAMVPSVATAQITTGIEGTVFVESEPDVGVVGATVYAVGASVTESTTTGPDGAYALELPAGTYDLTVIADGYVLQDVEDIVVTSGAVTVDVGLALIRPVLSGTVTDAETGDPLEGVAVEAMEFDSQEGEWVTRATVFTDAEGLYSFTTANLQEGVYRIGTTQDTYEGVTYAARFYALPDAVAAVEDADSLTLDWADPLTDIDIALDPPAAPAALSGRVICTAAQMPMPGTLVSIDGGAYETVTDSNGRYAFETLPPGEHEVVFSRVGFLAETHTVTIVEGQPTVLDVQLEVNQATVGKIFGLVTDAETGEPIDGVEVIVNNGWTSVQTDADGAYGVVVPESTHQLQFVKAGYETTTHMVPVGPAEQVRHDVQMVPDLTPTTGTLALTVTDSEGAPIAGAAVHIDNGSPSGTTNAQGEVTFSDLPPGDHVAHVVAQGFVSEEIDFVITVGQITSLTVELSAEVTGPVERVWDDNRFSGSVAVATDAFDTDPATPGIQWGDVRHVVVASGEDRAAADPLAAAGLVGIYDAPLFLVSRTSVSSEVKDAIDDIVDAAGGPVQLHIVGGPVSVPDARIAEIEAFVNAGTDLTAERLLSTGDRYDLAGAIAVRMAEEVGEPEVILLANGADPSKFFDALALSPIAAAQDYPILLVTRDGLPEGTDQALADIVPDVDAIEFVIGGGPATVSEDLENGLEGVVGDEDVTRWFGQNRYTTAIAIADGAVGRDWLARDLVGVAAKLPDALSGGASVGLQDGVLVLTETSRLTPATGAWLTDRADEIDRVMIFGGPMSVGPSVMNAITDAVTP